MMVDSVGNAEARSSQLQLLAMGFSHPNEELHRVILAGEYQSALAQSGLVVSLPPVGEDFADFEAAYIRLFQLGRKGRPEVSLNAADHEALGGSENRPEFLLGYSNWYRHFGLKTSDGEGANELPDHFVCQLEFLCWLAHLEVVNDEPSGYRLAQYDFTQRHLLPFVESLIASLKAIRQDGVIPFYRELAGVVLELLQALLSECQVDAVNAAEASAQSAADEDINVVNLWD